MPYRLLTVSWAVLIALVSTRIKPRTPDAVAFLHDLDKLGHFLAYLILAWLVAKSVHASKVSISVKTAASIGVMCAGYGLILEFVQKHFFPERMFEWQDQIANSAGTLAGLLIFLYIYPVGVNSRQ